MALANIGTATARFASNFIASFVAGIDHLLTAAAPEVALASIACILAMVNARLPPIAAAAGDRMRRPIPRRGYIDVIAAAAPIDVAAPITTRPPIAERPAGTEGKPARK
jgi:hypothetical protein